MSQWTIEVLRAREPRFEVNQGIKQKLDEIVRRIVTTAKPLTVVVFGSAARGTLGPHSDIDLLVVVPSGVHRRKTAQAIYRALFGVGHATDIVVVTEDDIKAYRDDPSMVIKPALDEGKVVYAA